VSIAAKHLDPVLGIDVHIILIPTPVGPVPTPLPNPFVGMVLDPFDYLPLVGATVFINGLPRAQAGTGGIAIVPHLPLGGPFGPPPPGNEAEVFMGSATVATDGDAQSYLGLLALTCQSIGMPAPIRPKGQPAKSLMLPTSVVLSIPMGPLVLIGGPPTISLMALAFRAGFAALGPIGRAVRRAQRGAGRFGRAMRATSRRARRAGDALANALGLGPAARNRINRAVCTVTGHPVDVATGKVFTEKIDFEIPGPLPLRWERVWYSTSTYRGPLGHGWHHNYDAALYVSDKVVLYRAPDGRLVSFPPLPEGGEHFDRGERLTLLRDHHGYTVRTIDRQSSRFTAVGRANGEHVLASQSDALGNTIAFRYDDQRRLAAMVDNSGRVFELTYDRNGQIAGIAGPHPDDANARIWLVRYTYDQQGNLVQAIDAMSQVSQFAYQSHLLVRETDRVGLNFYFQYDRADEHARCVRTWGDHGIYDHKLTYDTEHDVTTVENSLGQRTTYVHRGGLVVRTVDPLGAVTETEYGEHNELLAEIDPLKQRTESKYDDRGNLVQRTTADGAKVELAYDPSDRLNHATDALGGEWRFEHDQDGHLIRRTNPLGEATAFEWRGRQLSAITDPTGGRTALIYDGSGNLAQLIASDASESGWTYDALGRVVTQSDPNGNVQRRRRDLLGRVVHVTEADGNIRELSYDGEGNVVHARDRHHDVRFTYQGMGRLATRSEAGTTVRFEYDTEEQLIAIHNEHGSVYRFVLDPNGNVIEEHGFDDLTRRYVRDPAGRVTQVQRPGDRHSTYSYDPAGRVVQVVHNDGTQEQYAYRPNGDLITATNDTIAIAFERDALGRILRETQASDWVASTYGPLGLRESVRSSKGLQQTIRRNVLGDVLALEATITGASPAAPSPTSAPPGPKPAQPTTPTAFSAEFSRDRLGLELQRSLPGGVRAKWHRDQLGRPLRQEIFRGSAFHGAKQYTWDVDDRLRRVIDAVQGPVDYTHDAVGNLAAAAYSDGRVDLRMPDAVGNLFRTEHRSDRRYGPAGQLLESWTTEGATRYEYDPEGNLIRKVEPTGGEWLYEWNGAGMLTRVIRPDGAAVDFAYDPLGRRISKKYAGKVTRWIWDGNVPLHEWVERDPNYAEPAETTQPAQTTAAPEIADKARTALRVARPSQGPPPAQSEQLDDRLRGTKDAPITWLFEPESFAPLGKLVGDERFGIVTDHLGTPSGMFDGKGVEVWGADIDVYGELRNLRGAREACPFRWPGQYEDSETGLYYNRFRYYDAQTGEYTSQDPIALRGGLQLFSYAADPTRAADPWGLTACVPSDPRVAAAIASGRPIVVVGRGMSRVNPVADALRAAGGNVKTYNPRNFRSTPGNPNSMDVEANREWLRYWAKDKDALIIDIGHIPGKADHVSPFYEVERRSLYKNWSGVDTVQHDPGF
jgi:RHS repeat-associated protein